MSKFSVKVMGIDIRNPILKVVITIMALAVLAALAAMIIPIILAIVGIALIAASIAIVVLIVPHFILRAAGRRGFFIRTRDSIKIGLFWESFERNGKD